MIRNQQLWEDTLRYLGITCATLVISLFAADLWIKSAHIDDAKDAGSKASSTSQNVKENLMFPSTPAESKVSGEYMKALTTAYNAFVSEQRIPDKKRIIENYTIECRRDGRAYYIFFAPILPPGSKGMVGGENELGVSVTYAVNKSVQHHRKTVL
jgi:hypothetical protein